jgi:hypothetical protein
MIVELWNNMIKLGIAVQNAEHAGKTVDGRFVWQSVEAFVSSVNIKELVGKDLLYNASLGETYEKMEELVQKYKMDEHEFDPKQNHFFMQLMNLVKKKSGFVVALNRILQLAYNVGQLSYFIIHKETADDVVEFVESHNLKKIETYLTPEVLNEINMIVSAHVDTLKINETINEHILKLSEMEGGKPNYKKKYLKYKSKYLKLKNKKN